MKNIWLCRLLVSISFVCANTGFYPDGRSLGHKNKSGKSSSSSKSGKSENSSKSSKSYDDKGSSKSRKSGKSSKTMFPAPVPRKYTTRIVASGSMALSNFTPPTADDQLNNVAKTIEVALFDTLHPNFSSKGRTIHFTNVTRIGNQTIPTARRSMQILEDVEYTAMISRTCSTSNCDDSIQIANRLYTRFTRSMIVGANSGEFQTTLRNSSIPSLSAVTVNHLNEDNFGGFVLVTSSRTSSPTRGKSTRSPTGTPAPTRSPSTVIPTVNSSIRNPTVSPTKSPSPTKSQSPTGTPAPTRSPSSTIPTVSSPRDSPTISPTRSPIGSPIVSTTKSPSGSPTGSPKGSPSVSPTGSPTGSPKGSPSVSPTGSPTIPIARKRIRVKQNAAN